MASILQQLGLWLSEYRMHFHTWFHELSEEADRQLRIQGKDRNDLPSTACPFAESHFPNMESLFR